MTEHDDSNEVIDLLRSADPWPASRPVDPAIADRALAIVEKEIRMSEDSAPQNSPARKRLLLALAVLTAIAAVAGTAYGLSRGESTTAATSQGRPLGGGGSIQSCIQFSYDILAQSPIAFDGTVTKIDGNNVTFDVERWFRGGAGDSVTTSASGLVEGTASLEGGVGFVEGSRYLVSGDDTTGAIVPAICGFSMEHTDELAGEWATAFGVS
jgi:hypothetical protein